MLGAFVLNGALLGSWATRVPALAEQVGADAGALGLSLLGASVGMIAAALLSGPWCARFGARALMTAGGAGACALLPMVGAATSPVALGVVLVALGVTVGVMDVAMNVAGVTVLRRTGKPIMPVFHAGFSIGTLVGAVGAAVAAGNELSPLRHLAVVAVAAAVLAAAVARWIPVEEPRPGIVEPGAAARPGRRRPALWLLGCVALCASVAEGASADWSAFFGVHQRGLSEASAALIYAAFSVVMAATRLCGAMIQRRWGATRMLVAGSLVGGFGLLLAVAVPAPVCTFLGFALAGAGLAYASPVVVELGGSIGRRADGGGGEHEVAFVTTLAYSGFLLGPPLIGAVAELTGLLVALGFIAIVVLLIGPLAMAAAARSDSAMR